MSSLSCLFDPDGVECWPGYGGPGSPNLKYLRFESEHEYFEWCENKTAWRQILTSRLSRPDEADMRLMFAEHSLFIHLFVCSGVRVSVYVCEDSTQSPSLYVCELFECNLSAEYLLMETEELLMDTQIFKSDRWTMCRCVC